MVEFSFDLLLALTRVPRFAGTESSPLGAPSSGSGVLPAARMGESLRNRRWQSSACAKAFSAFSESTASPKIASSHSDKQSASEAAWVLQSPSILEEPVGHALLLEPSSTESLQVLLELGHLRFLDRRRGRTFLIGGRGFAEMKQGKHDTARKHETTDGWPGDSSATDPCRPPEMRSCPSGSR